MSFYKMQEALRAEGWFVEWNLPCCRSCAWSEVEHDDMSRVLFNYSQDCEIFNHDEEDCSSCDGTGFIELEDDGERYTEDCDYCAGEGVLRGSYDNLDFEPDVSVSGFACMPPEVAKESLFCFDGSDEGVKNLKAVLPLIEQAGCKVHWNKDGGSRIEISW
jgi:hypothetical protein